MRIIAIGLATFLSGCWIALAAAAPRSLDSRLAPIRAEIAAKTTHGEWPSVSVGVIRDGRILWSESFGRADREAGLSATPHTRYGLASLGKSLTATALMTLVEHQRLALDQRVFGILGRDAIRPAACGKSPTVRQLLNMTAGFAHGAETYVPPAVPPATELPPPRAFLAFCPGTTFYYSNYSIAAADRVIEAASGEPFGRYLQREVFAPLAMRDAALGTPAGFADPAARYDASGRRIGPIVTRPRSSRGIYASLDDLLRYAAFNLEHPIAGSRPVLSTASLRRMHADVANLPGATMALGWGSLTFGNGRHWLISNGNDMGVQSSITLLPESGLGVVVLINQSGDQADDLAWRIADALVPGTTAAIDALKTRYLSQVTPFVAAPAWLGRWSGNITTPNGVLPLSMEVLGDGKIRVALGAAAAVDLVEAQLNFGLLTGNFTGSLQLEQRAPGPHRIELAFRRVDDRMEGFVTANFASANGKFELPAAIALTRGSPKQKARALIPLHVDPPSNDQAIPMPAMPAVDPGSNPASSAKRRPRAT